MHDMDVGLHRFTEPTNIANQLLARYAEPERLIDYADCGEGFYLAGSGVSPFPQI